MLRVLDSRWVSRLGNLFFLFGVVSFAVRYVNGWDPLTVFAVLFIPLGVVLMLTPHLARWRQRSVSPVPEKPAEVSILAPAIVKAAQVLQKPAVVGSDVVAEAENLLAESESLETELWENHRVMNRSGWSAIGLPSDYRENVQNWNERVLALADKCLPLKDASQVAAYPKVVTLFVGAKTVEPLLEDNRKHLRRIVEMGKRDSVPAAALAVTHAPPPRPSALVQSLAKGTVDNDLRAHYISGKQLQRLWDVAGSLEAQEATKDGSALRSLEAVHRWVRELQNYIEAEAHVYLGRFNVDGDRDLFVKASGESPIPFKRRVLPALDRNVKVLHQILVERKAL